jgi:hypothetical protein
MAGERNCGTDRRCGRQLRLEPPVREGVGDAPHEHLLGSVRHAKQRRASCEIAEKTAAVARSRIGP